MPQGQLQKAPTQPLAGYQPPTPPGQTPPTSPQGQTGYAPPTPPPPPTSVPSQPAPTTGGVQIPGNQFGNNAIDWSHPPSWVPGGQIGQAIGTEIAKIMHPGQANWIGQNEPGPTNEQVGGDIIRSAAIPASLALAPATIPGMMAAGAGVGAASSGGNAMVNKANAGNVAQQAGVGGLLGAATAGIFGGLGKLLGSVGDKITMTNIKPSLADIKDGFSVDTINENNLGGTLNQTLTKTQALMKDLSTQLATKLQGSDAGIDLAQVFDDTKNQLASPEGMMSNFGQNAGLQRVFQKLQDEVLAVNSSGELSIPQAQVIKQAAGGMGAWQYGSADPDANATETVYNTFYRNLKTAIEENSPDGVKAINQKLSDLIPVMNAVIRRIPIAARNSGVTIPDMIGLVGSISNPMNLIPLALEKGATSGLLGNALSKVSPLMQSAAPAAGLLGSAASSSMSPQTASQ